MPAKLHNDLIKILNRNNKYILNLTSFIMSLSQAITIFLHNLLTSVSPMKLTLTILLLLNVIRDTSAFTASRTQRILTHYLSPWAYPKPKVVPKLFQILALPYDLFDNGVRL